MKNYSLENGKKCFTQDKIHWRTELMRFELFPSQTRYCHFILGEFFFF